MPDSPAALLRFKLATIDSEMASLHRQLTELARNRETVALELSRLAYPVLQLPNEITAEIFLKYAEDANLPRLFVLAAVCRSWRTISLSLQSFWTRLALDITAGDQQQSNLAKIQLPLALARAGAHSLLEIDLSVDNALEELLTLIAPTAARWPALNLSVGPPKLVHTILSWHFPKLQRLELMPSSKPIYSWSTTTPTHQPLANCPLLRSVILFDVDPNVLRLPWCQITHVELNASLGMTSCEYITVLAQTINLEVLDVYIDEGPEDFMEVKLPQLHTLTLRWFSATVNGAVDFINTLTAPALRNLTTNITSAGSHIGINAIADLLERSEVVSLDALTLHSHGHELGITAVEHIVAAAAPLGVLRLTEVDWDALDPLLAMLGSGGIYHDSPFLVRELHIQPVSGAVPYNSLKFYIDKRTAAARSADSESDVQVIQALQSYGLRKVSFIVPERLPMDFGSTDQDREHFDHLAALTSPEVIVRGSKVIWEMPGA
uniref:F-box domain-containing protein n=1 Tax=Mycena chlorophos TaxID=658473 RepID=A0ABQ0L321_MYCCL|nr:predicted protein [Mycena chlorophos]